MHLMKLISHFHITSNFFEWLGLVSFFLELKLRLKVSKFTIIHVFYLKFYGRQTPNLHFILAVCHFLKWVTFLGLTLLYKVNLSNPTHRKNCYKSTTAFKVTSSRGSLVSGCKACKSLACKNRICLCRFVNGTVWIIDWLIDWLFDLWDLM